jgi:hypothetical protein
MPFRRVSGEGMPVPVLAQLDRKEFEICVPFEYRRRDTGPWIHVPADERFARTDLASVPGFLLWLVPRYGAHTLAALLHDQLVKDPPGGDRSVADDIFRDALGELQVPLIRRWIMWATPVRERIAQVAQTVLWGVVVVLAAGTFWQRILGGPIDWEPWSFLVFGQSTPTDLGIVLAASILLVPRFGVGLVAGPAVVLILVPTVAILGVLVIYLALERVARMVVAVANRLLRSRAHITDNTVMMSRAVIENPAGCRELAGQTAATDTREV